MKQYILGGLTAIAVLALLSYTTTDGRYTNGGLERVVYDIPLRQSHVVTTGELTTVNKLIKKGYRVEFVTENRWNGSSGTETTYTLIKY